MAQGRPRLRMTAWRRHFQTGTPLIFKYEDRQLRTIEIEGEPWFHATDVCKCVGLTVTGSTYPHLQKLDANEKRSIKRSHNPVLGADGDRPVAGAREFLGTAPAAAAINESGLYRLTMRADGAKVINAHSWGGKRPSEFP